VIGADTQIQVQSGRCEVAKNMCKLLCKQRVRGSSPLASTSSRLAQVVNQHAVLRLIRENRGDIRERFGVSNLLVFGSVARGEAGPDSDVDVLVDFGGPATLLAIIGLADYLEELLGRRVDLVTRNSLPTRMLRNIENEAIQIA
jgi:predicted nucleotidyltransferase